MTKFLVFSAVFFSIFGTKTYALSEDCIAEGTSSIVDYLLQQEPASQFSLIKNASEISGIHDATGNYEDFDLLPITKDTSGAEFVTFQSGSYAVWVDVTETVVQGKITCAVGTVDWGQDDQD